MSREYLLQYGSSAFVGRFWADAEFVRGQRAVIESPRGRELGTVLCEPHEKFVATVAPDRDGRVIRPAAAADEDGVAASRALADRILDAAATAVTAAGLPALILDCEVLLESSAAILHVTTWAATDLTPLAESLTQQFGCPVRFHDLAATTLPEEPGAPGCGKPDCGSGGGGCGTGGGCSTGGCSRGKVKSSGELTAYFRDLREKMEADVAGRRELL
ncbi:hypothetical protein [Limnoglobus roseus]|uniref:Signal peptidase n=1 Tax=Limnoglobus roseus TaxID=2598579 RepID=A0A5C1A6A4_9BACT|nr:hypothetical protein [Limnoglobus roseus]QEL14240.1 signal peptidase [Limnoglobus roseus]